MWKLDLPTRLFVALVIGVFMGALDLTILAPALPHLSGSFGVTPAAMVLAFSLYAAFYAVAVPVMSKLADIRGYRLIYTISMMLFAGGSAVAALAPTLPVLILGRAIQGIGGGGLFPVAQAIVGVMLGPRQRGQALGLLMGAFAIGGILGPNLGGYLVQHLSWHWIFWINVPLGALGAALLRGISIPGTRRRARLDWTGAILVAIAFGSLVIGFESLRDFNEHGLLSPEVLGPFVLAIAGLLVLIPVERTKEEPILDFRLIASRAVAPLLAVSALVGFALLSGVLFVPLYMQLRFGASALGSGAVLNAAAVGLGLSSWIAGAYTQRFGARTLVIVGMASTALGLGVMIVTADALWGILAGLVLLGAGLGLAQGPISYLGLELAPEKDRGQISGLISITRSMGGAFGVSLAGVMLSGASRLARERMSAEAAGLGTEVWGSDRGLEVLREAPETVQVAIRSMLGGGIIEGWYWALGAALLGLLFAWLIRVPVPAQEKH